MISKDDFNKLSLDDKGNIVFFEGKYIASREYYNQLLMLYDLGSYFVEVFYNSHINLIANIQIMKDIKTLDIYIDSEIKQKS